MARRGNAGEAVAQPIATPPGAPPPPRRRDWTARTRDTALNALRYSRFVTVMKRALPMTAAALIATVIIFSLIPRQSDKISLMWEKTGKVDNDLAMIKPKLTGADAKGNPFTVTADSAVQDGPSAKRARLNNVQADVNLQDGRWLNATAAKGYVDMDNKKLVLSGGIAVFSDDGYEIHTARADVDLDKGTLRGNSEVTGHGPSGTLRADRFELDQKTQQLVLQGNVRMTLASTPR